MNLHFGKMSRRKQAKPNRLNEDEENDSAVFNGESKIIGEDGSFLSEGERSQHEVVRFVCAAATGWCCCL